MVRGVVVLTLRGSWDRASAWKTARRVCSFGLQKGCDCGLFGRKQFLFFFWGREKEHWLDFAADWPAFYMDQFKNWKRRWKHVFHVSSGGRNSFCHYHKMHRASMAKSHGIFADVQRCASCTAVRSENFYSVRFPSPYVAWFTTNLQNAQ